MPLRDHFHSPVNDKHRWDGVYGGWPAEMVRTLFDILPPDFQAAPKVTRGSPFEVNASTTEDEARPTIIEVDGTATPVAGAPTLTVLADLFELDEYEVRVYDNTGIQTLVAAIEIVSPSNKDRPDTRAQFVSKVAAFLRQDVCVAIVDIVSIRQANLYAELLARLGRTDPRLSNPPPALYAVTLRRRKPPRGRPLLDAWFHPLTVGEPLPTLPLWLSPDLRIELPLEPGYQEVCRLLRIG